MGRAVVVLQSLQPLAGGGVDDPAAEHFLARLTFTLQVGTQTFADLHSRIKLTPGSRGAERSFEVSAPFGYGGPFNHAAFQQIVQTCCRALIDERIAAGRPARTVAPGTDCILMNERHDFPVGGSAAGW